MISIQRRISKYNFSSGNDIQFIVIHSTGNYTDTAAGNANYFNEGDRQASAHYFVDAKSIFQVVEDYNAAWHCGDGHMIYGIGNHNSIGIEMCHTNGIISAETINNTLDLVRVLMAKYGVSSQNVVRHYDASRKCCPQPWSPNSWAKWNEFKTRLVSGTSSDTNIQTVDIKTIQHSLNVLKIRDNRGCALIEDGVMGPNTIGAITNFQSVMGLLTDGIFGDITNAAMLEVMSMPLCGMHYSHPYATKYIQWRLGILKDGVFGEGTYSAVYKWQLVQGLTADGLFGSQSWGAILK